MPRSRPTCSAYSLHVAAVAVAHPGAGPTRDRVWTDLSQHRRASERLGARTPAPSAAPHATVTITYDTANSLVAEVLPEIPPVPLDVPGPLRLVIPDLDVAATSVHIAPQGYDRVVATITMDVRANGNAVLQMTVDAELEPRVVVEAGETWVSLGFGPDNVTSVRPRLPPDAAATLGDALYDMLPQAARKRVPKLVAMTAASTIVGGLSDRTYKMLRTTLLTRVGTLTSLRLPLAGVPVQDVRIRSLLGDTPSLVVELHTTLSVRRGVSTQGAPTVAGTTAAVRVSGSAAAELANWAMTTGLAPNRFNRKLEPRRGGDYHLRLDWEGRREPSAQGKRVSNRQPVRVRSRRRAPSAEARRRQTRRDRDRQTKRNSSRLVDDQAVLVGKKAGRPRPEVEKHRCEREGTRRSTRAQKHDRPRAARGRRPRAGGPSVPLQVTA